MKLDQDICEKFTYCISNYDKKEDAYFGLRKIISFLEDDIINKVCDKAITFTYNIEAINNKDKTKYEIVMNCIFYVPIVSNDPSPACVTEEHKVSLLVNLSSGSVRIKKEL